MRWQGVMPAITTPFQTDLAVDHAALRSHVSWLAEAGCTGIVALGSLGEGATLSAPEKKAILETCVKAAGQRVPVVAGISALSTHEAVELARMASDAGCKGLMVLPPYVYSTDWREMKAHVAAVLKATPLSAMLYNNPIAYRTDFLPEQIAELADEFPHLHAVKESSGDIRRVTAILALMPHRLAVFVGLDDVVVEGIQAGAVGWIAGLVNALPQESVKLFDLAAKGRMKEALELYRWFLPLLRLDTGPKFVQLIKLVQQMAGKGHEQVRPPRLILEGDERRQAVAIIEQALAKRPHL